MDQWIDWVSEKPLPKPGALLDAGELGIAVVKETLEGYDHMHFQHNWRSPHNGRWVRFGHYRRINISILKILEPPSTGPASMKKSSANAGSARRKPGRKRKS